MFTCLLLLVHCQMVNRHSFSVVMKYMGLMEPGGFNFDRVSQQKLIVYQNYLFLWVYSVTVFISFLSWLSVSMGQRNKNQKDADESHIGFWRINFRYFLHTHFNLRSKESSGWRSALRTRLLGQALSIRMTLHCQFQWISDFNWQAASFIALCSLSHSPWALICVYSYGAFKLAPYQTMSRKNLDRVNEKRSRWLFSQESERWQVNEVSPWKWNIPRSHLQHKNHVHWQSVIAMTIYLSSLTLVIRLF